MSSVSGDSSNKIETDISTDFSQGKLEKTGKAYDLAIAGAGFFVLNGSSGPLYSRQGQFQLDAQGRLTTTDGFSLQLQGGGDLVLKGGKLAILDDGSVTEDGEPIGKIAVMDILDAKAIDYAKGDLITTHSSNLKTVETPSIKQGMLETSNVTVGPEMVSIMEALRRAETGQRLVTVYDDLMGRVLSTLGQAT